MDVPKCYADGLIGNRENSSFLKKLAEAPDVQTRIKLLDHHLSMLNLTKCRLGELPYEDQLRIVYIFQCLGFDHGLCEYFRIFWSRQNSNFHQICEATREKLKCVCHGNINECGHGFFDKNGEPLRSFDLRVKNRPWDKI
jgi:hypothetical protein